MKNLESLKARSQESVAHLLDLGKQQPEEVQTWGVTTVAAVAGAVALAAVAKGVLGIIGTLAYPPVALTAGALGGGVLGWSFMQQRTAPPSSAGEPVTEITATTETENGAANTDAASAEKAE